MAGLGGLEPPTSSLSGIFAGWVLAGRRRDDQLRGDSTVTVVVRWIPGSTSRYGTRMAREGVWLVPTYNGRLIGHRPARVCSGHLFVPGCCRWARTDSQSNTAKPTRAATIGAPTHSTNPAPMLAPMTPAVRTRHPAPHSAPASTSSTSTGHQRRSKRPARPACISATTRCRRQDRGADPGDLLGRRPDVEGSDLVIGVWKIGRQITNRPPGRDRHRHDQHDPGTDGQRAGCSPAALSFPDRRIRSTAPHLGRARWWSA
jgi:hypothetical protein